MIILRNKNYSHNVMPPKKDGDPCEVKVITTNFKGHEEGTDPEYMDPKTRKSGIEGATNGIEFKT